MSKAVILRWRSFTHGSPCRWDPSRYERGEDKKQQFAYLGWGAGLILNHASLFSLLTVSAAQGRHPCLGMRLAKLEFKIMMAMFLTRYDYTLVDRGGALIGVLPEPYRDNL